MKSHSTVVLALAVLGGLIGAVSFSGSLIAFGKLQDLIKRSFRFRGQNFVNLAVLLASVLVGASLVFAAAGPDAGHGHPVFRPRAGSRRDHDATDWRRRHAGGDLALQRAHRPGRRLRGLRAQQRRHDHCRHGRGLRRHAADPVDGQGHEPVTGQRAVLRLWRHRWYPGRRERHDEGHRRRRRRA